MVCDLHKERQCSICRKFERLMKLLEVPRNRVPGSEVNANWFLRQGIIYHNHPQFLEAREAALACLK
jgi:hypothetical protein